MQMTPADHMYFAACRKMCKTYAEQELGGADLMLQELKRDHVPEQFCAEAVNHSLISKLFAAHGLRVVQWTRMTDGLIHSVDWGRLRFGTDDIPPGNQAASDIYVAAQTQRHPLCWLLQ